MPALILMYHDLCDDPEKVSAEHRPYVLEPLVFRRQLEAIKGSGLQSLTVQDWCTVEKPTRGVILTFDDGHVSNHDVALPLLREFGLKATFFITAGRIGTGDTMDWSQIRALHAGGMEIGSHTLTHRAPSTLDDEELRYELSESRRVLEDGLGAPITSISSPTGFFNPRMRDIAQAVGYRALCIGRVGLAAGDGDAFSLNRIAVKRAMSQKQFEALLRFDWFTLGSIRLQQRVRELAREMIGVESYLRIRRILIRSSHS